MAAPEPGSRRPASRRPASRRRTVAVAADDPPSVRLIVGLRRRLDRRRRELAVAILALALAAAVAAGLYTVANGETAALLAFGALADDTVGPGLHLAVPAVHEVRRARTGDVFRLVIEGDAAPELALLTGDENVIETTLVVQYRIADLSQYLFATESPEELLRQAVRAALVESLVATPVDEVLTSAKARLQGAARQSAQERLDRYRSGLLVVAVNLQTVSPPPEARGAFRAVSDARAEAAQAIERAQGDRDRALRLARGEADKILTEAGTAADRRLQGARGAAERFAALLRQKRRAPEQTRSELLNAAAEKVLPAARVVILAPGAAPQIDLHYFERSADRRPRAGEGIPPGVSFDDR